MGHHHAIAHADRDTPYEFLGRRAIFIHALRRCRGDRDRTIRPRKHQRPLGRIFPDQLVTIPCTNRLRKRVSGLGTHGKPPELGLVSTDRGFRECCLDRCSAR